jgi:hypothetical protein
MESYVVDSPNVGFVVEPSSACGCPIYSAVIVDNQQLLAVIVPE